MKNSILKKDVYWKMQYPYNDIFKEKSGTTEIVFEESMALAHLLMNEILILNTHWWKEEWPEDAQNTFAFAVNTNDTFYRGADAVEVKESELQSLYDHFLIDELYGSTVWAAKKLNLMPLEEIANRIRNNTNWDIDSLGLTENYN